MAYGKGDTGKSVSMDYTLALAEDKGNSMPRTAQQLYLQDHLQRVHYEIESTTRKLELEKRRLNKLDEDVIRMRKEHEEKVLKIKPKGIKGDTQRLGRLEDQTRDPARATSQDPPKKTAESGLPARKVPDNLTVRQLEHRLGKAISELNSLCHENQDLRAKIDQTRRERLQMNQVFKKLHGDIKDNTQCVLSLQRETDAARREHDERQSRMTALRKQLESERRAFKALVQKLQKVMRERERDELTQKVQSTKTFRNPNDPDKGEDDKRNKTKTKSLKADEEELFNSPGMMRRILKLAFLNSIQRRHIKQHQKNIEVFEQAFATIKSTTGISDIEEIVKIFVQLEQRNFSLLTYVNALNSEIESFDKQNRELEDQVSTQKRVDHENEQKRNMALTDLIAQIDTTKRATAESAEQAKEQGKVFESCKVTIKHILTTVEKENKAFGGQPAPETTGENVLGWLEYIEKTLTQWRDFLPETKDSRHKQPSKNYKYTVGNQVLMLQPKKQNIPQLVKPAELPSAASAFSEHGGQARGGIGGRDEESSDEEDEMQNRALDWVVLREKALASVAKRRKHRRTEAPGAAAAVAADAARADGGDAGGGGAADADANDMGYDDMVQKEKAEDDESDASSESELDDDVGPTDEEINEIFLKRYNMSKEELQRMAQKMGIQLNNLCYLKQEFDAYDEDRSGYIDVKELKGLLEKLGEELSDEELDQAFRELDSDNSGEIEFFEFVEWFTSED